MKNFLLKKKKKDEELPFKEEEKKEELRNEDFYSDLIKDLKDIGVLKSIEIKDDEKIDEERFIELQKKEIENRVDESINNFLQSLDEESKLFIQYKLQGGSTQKFFEIMNSDINSDAFDYNDETKAEEFLTNYYSKYSDMDIDDIKSRIKLLKDDGKLSEYAEKYHKKVIDNKINEEKEMLKRQEKENAEAKEKIELYKSDLNKFIQDTESFNGINITKERRKEIYNFITNPTIKVGNSYITPMQKALNDLFNNKEALVLVANWAMDKYSMDMFKQGIEKKVIKDTKEKLFRTSKQARPVSSSRDGASDGIWNFFN